ncbi:MAG: right-handed parallel beta-helix repeat-containing protein [Bacteroidales bacterium]|nr:right-handed parallel beta-helix repeat-containing protein [Bacteroidales bacterium]
MKDTQNSQTRKTMKRSSAAFLMFISLLLNAVAQPSGGPYGPVQQKYELPKVTGKTYFVAPDGKAESAGDQLSQPTTIEQAIAKAESGDAIILRGGTYRTGDLEFNQGITIQPYADEQPVLKGTLEAKEWRRIGGGMWKTTWKKLFQADPDDWWTRDWYGWNTPLHLFNNDMVFVDGKLLRSAGWEGDVDENSFYIDYKTGSVYLGVNPANHLVEITAFNHGFRRVVKDVNDKKNDHKGVIMRGITLTQYAYCAFEIDGYEPQALADPATFGKDVVGSVIENCTFSYCGRVGVYLRGDNTVLRNCNVHHTTTEGVYLLSSSDCLLEKNRFSQNNIEDINGYYPAAVKIFNQTYRVTCKDNLVYDLPISNGIWYDVGNIDGRFINNWVVNVGTNKGKFGDARKMWSNYNGFFFEISKGATVAGNVFENCDQAVFALNSSNVEIYQNTFINSTVCIGRDKRSAQGDHFGWHPSTGPDVDERFGHVFVNNLMVGDVNFVKPLMLVYQHKDLCEKLNKTPLKRFDYNVFVEDINSGYDTLMSHMPASKPECVEKLVTLNDLKGLFEGSAANSKVFKGFNIPVFKSLELGNYELNKAFPGASAATVLPAEVQKLLGLPAKYKPYIGAYPVQ